MLKGEVKIFGWKFLVTKRAGESFLVKTCPLQRSSLVAYDMDSKEVSVIATLDDGTDLTDTARYVPCWFSWGLPVLTNKHWRCELSMEHLSVKSSRLGKCVISSLLLGVAMGASLHVSRNSQSCWRLKVRLLQSTLLIGTLSRNQIFNYGVSYQLGTSSRMRWYMLLVLVMSFCSI